MKKLIALAAAGMLFAGLLCRAGQVVLLGTPVTVNGATNTASTSIGSVAIPQQGVFYIYNGGLASTNALTVNVQISVDNTNFYTIGTYVPTVTNSVTDTFVPPYTNQTIWMRAQVVTTNAVSVTGTYLH